MQNLESWVVCFIQIVDFNFVDDFVSYYNVVTFDTPYTTIKTEHLEQLVQNQKPAPRTPEDLPENKLLQNGYSSLTEEEKTELKEAMLGVSVLFFFGVCVGTLITLIFTSGK